MPRAFSQTSAAVRSFRRPQTQKVVPVLRAWLGDHAAAVVVWT